MNFSEPYNGEPFVGLVRTTTIDNLQNLNGMRMYCLLKPTTDKDIGGMHEIPAESHLVEHPWVWGIKGLAAIVISSYGKDYEQKVTFEPPPVRIVGSDENPCTYHYERLSNEEQEELRRTGRQFIDI